MERRKDFGMLDETDVQIVVKDKQTPAWTGSWSELPPAELFEQVKKFCSLFMLAQIYLQRN